MLLDFSQLRGQARHSLEQARKPERIILLHTGVVLFISLVLTALDYLLDRQIATAGGLSNIGTRSVLTTIQSLFRLAQTIALPFWQVGYTYYVVRVAREKDPGYSDLLEGFRRFAPVLRLKILMGAMAFALMFVCAYAASFLFMMTPWAAPIMAKLYEMEAVLTNEQAMLDAVTAMVQDASVPIMLLFGVCFLVGAFFLFFRFRFAELWLMDHPNGRAREALRNSRELMRGNWKAMLRIDLRFWWFYLLELLVTVLGYGDMILDSIGIEMTTGAFGTYLIFTFLYIWAQMALYWWKRNEVSVTYAHAYTALCPEEIPQEEEPATT